MYWITGVLGLAFAAAPYLLGYANDQVALWTSIILGGTVAAVSLFEAAAKDKDRWEYWVAGLVGLVAIAAPFILGFGGTSSPASLTSIAIGLMVTFIAVSRLSIGEGRV